MIRKLEAIANVAVVIAAVVLCSIAIKKYLLPTLRKEVVATQTSIALPAAPQKRSIAPGTRISLPEVDWSKSKLSVLLALSTKCHFCSESAPFYQQLQQAMPKNVAVVTVLPQTVDDSKPYVNKLGLSSSRVVQSTLASVNVSGTPTLMLIDQNGVVKDSWIGKLSDQEIKNVLERIAKLSKG